MKDGGRAFPSMIPLIHDDEQGKDYPHYEESGMSLRDWFAGQAIPVSARWEEDMPTGSHTEHLEPSYAGIAARAYLLADAMLKEREQ